MSLVVLLSAVSVALTQSQSITLANHAGCNEYWYSVTVDAPEGVVISSIKMKDSKMASYEEGLWAWDYVFQKNFFQWMNWENMPYTAPYSFQVTLSTGQVLEGTNIISSTTDYEEGTISVSGAYTGAAYTAEDESITTVEEGLGLSSGAIAAIVICSVVFGCLMGAVCMVCYQKRDKVIVSGVQAEKVEDEEVMVDVHVTNTMQLEA